VVDTKPWPLYPLERDLVPIVLEAGSWQVQKILPQPEFDPQAVGGRGDIWHTFHVIIFHFFFFFVLIKFNVTACVSSNTLQLQSDLHKFDIIHKEKEGRAFSLTVARVLTFPADGVSWHMVKIHGKSRWHLFKVLKKQIMINVMFYKTDVSDTCCSQQQVVIVVIKWLENNNKIWNKIQHIYLNWKRSEGKGDHYNTSLSPATCIFILNEVFQFHQIGSFKQTQLGLPSVHPPFDRNLQSVHWIHISIAVSSQ